MNVFEIIYDVCVSDSKEITREIKYVTGCWISICESSIRHAEEYEKELISIRKVLTVTQQMKTGLTYYEATEGQ